MGSLQSTGADLESPLSLAGSNGPTGGSDGVVVSDVVPGSSEVLLVVLFYISVVLVVTEEVLDIL